MLTAMEKVTEAPKAAIKFAAARPIAFSIICVVLVLVTLRYAAKIRETVIGLPVVGKLFAKVVG